MRASALRSRDRKAIARQLQSVADRRKNHQRYLKSETVDPHKSMVVLGKIADFMPQGDGEAALLRGPAASFAGDIKQVYHRVYLGQW